MKSLLRASAMLSVLAAAAWAGEQPLFEIRWWTVDGGGAIRASTKDLDLSGTIGQPDAGMPIAVGTTALIGGFWSIAMPTCASIRGDVNGDFSVTIADVPDFVRCLLATGGSNCVCADMDRNSLLNGADIQLFVEALLP